MLTPLYLASYLIAFLAEASPMSKGQHSLGYGYCDRNLYEDATSCPQGADPIDVGGGSYACCFPEGASIQSVLKASSKPSLLDTPNDYNVCLRMVLPPQATCPDGWTKVPYEPDDEESPVTCCLEASKRPEARVQSSRFHTSEDEVPKICMRALFPDGAGCPEGWVVEDLGGGFHTCCKFFSSQSGKSTL